MGETYYYFVKNESGEYLHVSGISKGTIGWTRAPFLATMFPNLVEASKMKDELMLPECKDGLKIVTVQLTEFEN